MLTVLFLLLLVLFYILFIGFDRNRKLSNNTYKSHAHSNIDKKLYTFSHKHTHTHIMKNTECERMKEKCLYATNSSSKPISDRWHTKHYFEPTLVTSRVTLQNILYDNNSSTWLRIEIGMLNGQWHIQINNILWFTRQCQANNSNNKFYFFFYLQLKLCTFHEHSEAMCSVLLSWCLSNVYENSHEND